MTLWNPLNVFSGRASSVDEGPAASFDPSRTRDPLAPRPGDPAIGIGDAHVGAAGPADPRRNPIGFAPPAEKDPGTRFRTEISFRRHHELPRASATPAEPDNNAHTAWQSPEPDASVVGESAVIEETPPSESSTPFYKREIGFRRKKAAPTHEEASDSVAFEDEIAVEPAPTDQADAAADVVEVVARADDPVEETETAAEVEEADAPAAEAVAPDDADAGEVAAEPVAAKIIPFYKREIGFRRKKAAPTDEEASALVASEDEVAADPATTDEAEAAADVVEVAARADDPVEETEAPEAIEEADVPAAVEEADVPAAEVVAAGEAEAVASEDADAGAGATDPVAAEVLPFYKREISFRRKKAVAEVVAAQLVANAVTTADETPDDSVEVAAHADDPVQKEAHEDPVAVEPSEAPAADEPGAETEPAPEPVAEAEQPFETVAPAGPASPVEVEEPHEMQQALGAAVTAAVVASSASSGADPEPAEVVEPLPATEAEAEITAEPSSPTAEATDDAPAADAPAAPGRFGSRKDKAAASRAAKRQRSSGTKGRKVVGLKIGASQLAAAVVTETDTGRELSALARRPLAAGIVVDGEVRDEPALANAIKSFFDEEKLPKNDVHLGLSSNRIGVRTLDVASVEDESRFDNAVRFKAHEVLPVALSESVLDYSVLDEHVGEDGEWMRRVLLVVAPRDQVEPYQRVAGQAGITLTTLDLEALGLLRAFVEPGSGAPTSTDTATVVAAIGHESSTLLVAGAGSCEFTRVFDWGGGDLVDAIATSLDVLPAEAATILRHLSLSGPGRQYEALDDATRAKATDAVRQRLTPFARELVNSLQFYQTQAESLGIGGILVTGGTSHLEGLDDALHQMIGVDVSVGDPLARVIPTGSFDPDVEASIGSLAVSIGLAIDDLSTRGVNLLPKGSQPKRANRSTLISIGVPVAAAVPLAALSFFYLNAHSNVVSQQSQLDAVRAEIATLPRPKAPVISTGVVGDEAARATAVASVLGGRVAWDAVFRDMSRILPENVWLSTLSLTQPVAANLADGTAAPTTSSTSSTTTTPAAPTPIQGPPTAVSIDGYTYTQPDVARLLARLATLPSLQRVTLTSSQSENVGTKPVIHFVIVADLNQTGGAS